jgi:hypothetical protein
MRDTKVNGLTGQATWEPLRRGLRFAVMAAGIGLIITASAARAGDDGDDEDDMTFEESIIDNIMKGIGATNMENRGIDYRERSPLVVPPRLDLPPPASSSAELKAPNWPKDPDEAQRKAAIAARKKEKNKKAPTQWEAARPLTPAELDVGKTAAPARTNNDPVQPGANINNPVLSPSQLGYNGGLLGMFKGNKEESVEFKGEPPRQSLVEPPPGYQTPSPNFAYGTGPKESLNKQYDVLTGKER